MNRNRRYPPEQYACADGHILYSENVWIDRNGFFLCKACSQINNERPEVAAQRAFAQRRLMAKKRKLKAS